jgi:hypothetical protein
LEKIRADSLGITAILSVLKTPDKASFYRVVLPESFASIAIYACKSLHTNQ